jgi:hypothetical protein
MAMVRERLLGRRQASFRHQMMAVYFAGYFWARWRERRAGPVRTQVLPVPLPPPPESPSKVVSTDR